MIPILYDSKDKLFDTKGIGALSDAFSCSVSEERNGKYELDMVYPVGGNHFSDLKNSNVIMAQPSDGAGLQPFRIYRITKPLNGKCHVYAEHISYQLNMLPVAPFSATGVSEALTGLVSNSVTDCPFTVWTDISNAEKPFRMNVPLPFRKALGGVQGSILDTYGGEFEFDRYTVKLHAHRGSDNGVSIRYGKNLTDLSQEESIENVVTGIMPYYFDDDGNYVELPEQVIECEAADNYPFRRTITMDFSTEFEDVPSEEELRAKAQSYVNANITGIPDVSLKVSFIALWNTSEFRNIAHIERVKLCDTVYVYFERLGVTASAKVIATDWDVLHERYNSISIGAARSSLSSTIAEVKKAQEDAEEENRSALESALSAQKRLMSGGLGGNVVISYNGEGKPSEITFGDSDSIETMVNCIRINSAGISFSKTGYNGDFTSAWTIDGHFAAENIDTGYISSERIAAESIQVAQLTGSLQNLAKSVTVNSDGIHIYKFDESNAVEAVMEADGLHLYSGTLELAYFTTTRASVRNLYAETYLYVGTHRYEAFEFKRMSDGGTETGTAHFYGGRI